MEGSRREKCGSRFGLHMSSSWYALSQLHALSLRDTDADVIQARQDELAYALKALGSKVIRSSKVPGAGSHTSDLPN